MKLSRWKTPAPILLIVLLLQACMSTAIEPELIKLTRQFVAAYNDHDAGAMAAMVADDVRWMSVDGSTIGVETSGRDALRTAMQEYFAARPPSPSRMRTASSDGQFVLGVEEVLRKADDDKSNTKGNQCSAVVYEFSGTLIRNVWYYYPAYPC